MLFENTFVRGFRKAPKASMVTMTTSITHKLANWRSRLNSQWISDIQRQEANLSYRNIALSYIPANHPAPLNVN